MKKYDEITEKEIMYLLTAALVIIAGGILFWILGKNFAFALFYWMLAVVMAGCFWLGLRFHEVEDDHKSNKSTHAKK